MTGLLIKDFYTTVKQLRYFLLIIVIFSFIPNFAVGGFALVYAAMLPITAIAYDERSKWNRLAATMPYSAFHLVFSKYLLGYLLVTGALVLSLAAQTAAQLVTRAAPEPETPVAYLLLTATALIFQAINLPIMIKLGVEKGRLLFMLVIAGFVATITILSDRISDMADITLSAKAPLQLGALAAAVLLNVVSVAVAVAVYKKKEF